jgi:hypothetical protein
MRITGIVGGGLVAAMGVIWMLQGVNSAYAPPSFMTGNLEWTVIGFTAIVLGIGLAVWSWRRTPGP